MLIKVENVTIISAIDIKEVAFAFVASGIGMFNVSFFSSFIAIHFSKVYGVSEKTMGYYFALQAVAYISSSYLVPKVFNKVPRKLQFVTCFFFSTIAMALMGPLSFGSFYIVLFAWFLLNFV